MKALPFILAGCLITIICGVAWVNRPMPPQDPRIAWAVNQNKKCRAMGGTAHNDAVKDEVSCYRHPFGRMTKHLFTEKFP
jgi:hypothetical protein